MKTNAGPSPMWLIWSNEHNAWWMPACYGYTQERIEAGRYTFDEALEIVKNANQYLRGEVPNEAMIREDAFKVRLLGQCSAIESQATRLLNA